MEFHDGGGKPPRRGGRIDRAEALGSALRGEFLHRRHATKTVGRWTGAAERTVKGWFAGACLPRGDHLIALVGRSDAALAMVLEASGRLDLLDSFRSLRRLPDRPVRRRDVDARRGPDGGPDRGADGDPVPSSGFGPERAGDREAVVMDRRRRRFVDELRAGQRVDAAALEHRFTVSRRTAKRDIAALRASGAVRFVGTCRRGRYTIPPSKR